MEGSGVIDHFLEVFARYIDSGFGLLGGEAAFIATTLIAIDMTLAALFWAWGADDDILARLIKKTLFVGAFAYIISNWNALARIVFESFAGLGLLASGTGVTPTELLRPGRVAQVGMDAAAPLIEATSELLGFVSFFENFVQIAVLLTAWLIVIIAFFVLTVQLFVTLIEFKLATLCGFVLVPFALFNKTAFMAERVLGHVISSGIKVLVLAVIVGIGSTLFGEFTTAIGEETPTIEDALAIVLAAVSLMGLGVFGPGIANGIVAGGPQLGAGAAAGTVLGGAAVIGGGAAAARLGAETAGKLAGGAARGGAYAGGAASTAYSLGAAGRQGPAAVAGGLKGVGVAAASAAASPLRRAAQTLSDSRQAGARAAVAGTGGAIKGAAPPAPAPNAGAPAWARRMQVRQAVVHGAAVAAHTLGSGDSRGAGAAIDLKDKD